MTWRSHCYTTLRLATIIIRVILAYMDESGQAEYNLASKRRHFVRSCVIIRESQYSEIEKQIKEVCDDLPFSIKQNNFCQFHTTNIFHAAKDWKEYEENLGLRKRLLIAMARVLVTNRISVAFALLDKTKILASYEKTLTPPVITFLMAGKIMEDWIRKYAPDQRWQPVVGKSDYNRHIEEAHHQARTAGMPITSFPWTRAVDSLAFASPQLSRIFLLSDLCAFVLGRQKQGKDDWDLHERLKECIFNVWEFQPQRTTRKRK